MRSVFVENVPDYAHCMESLNYFEGVLSGIYLDSYLPGHLYDV